jgi:hypothetical protein
MNPRAKLISVILFLFLFWVPNLYGQLFKGASGKSFTDLSPYQCSLRINQDSTIDFIYHQYINRAYSEFKGVIKKVNDTTYRISSTSTIEMACNRSYTLDTFKIKFKHSFSPQFKEVKLRFSNGKEQMCVIPDTKGTDGIMKVPIDKTLFTRLKGSNMLTLSVSQKNSITGESLSFKVSWGDGPVFSSGEKLDFNVFISGSKVRTENLVRVGRYFELAKSP